MKNDSMISSSCPVFTSPTLAYPQATRAVSFSATWNSATAAINSFFCVAAYNMYPDSMCSGRSG